MSKKIGLIDIKQALRDHRFRDLLPETMKDDITKYLQNPGCACNMPLYRRILSECVEQLKQYYPNTELASSEEEMRRLATNKWTVINCRIDELEKKLQSLPTGRKQIEMARWQDQITVIVNELDVLF